MDARKGICPEKCNPQEPWQSGKAENQIEVLVNIARTNLAASGLSNQYRARAISYAANVSNVQYHHLLSCCSEMTQHDSGLFLDKSQCCNKVTQPNIRNSVLGLLAS